MVLRSQLPCDECSYDRERSSWLMINFGWLLVALVTLLLSTLAVTYTISVRFGHVPPFLPYISETGTFAPESCIFGLAMNVASFLYMLAVYLRYRQLHEYGLMRPSSAISKRANRLSFILGALSSFGLCMVANFQVKTLPLPHFVGAFFCFVLGTVYFIFQAMFSRRMVPDVSSACMVRLRLSLSALSAVAFIVCIACGSVAIRQFDGTSQTLWGPNDKGYFPHVISTTAEWLVALMFIGNILSYVPEMRRVDMEPPKFQMTLSDGLVITLKS